jgi:23S rRNA (guanosine2251-2'-O)-methyltransferase
MKKRPEPRRREFEHRGRSRPDEREVPDSNRTFGVLPVLELLRAASRRLERIVIAEGVREARLNEVFDLARENGIRVDRVPRPAFEKLAGPGNHQGVIAFAAAADYVEVDDIVEHPKDIPLIVILDGVEDPRNLGAIIRTVECASADGIIIPERRAVGLTETVAKSAAGATEYVKVAKATNLNRVIEDLKKRNVWVVGTDGDAKMDYTEWDWRQPTALVLGGEGSGLHRLVAENCDALVKIPMYGRINSLNVSVAAGVILFEARRQRSKEE